MVAATPKYAFVLAVLIGIIIFFIPGDQYQEFIFAICFLSAGALLGYFWPQPSWKWGLWIAGPLIVFLGLSVLFAGQLEVFFKKDFPLLLIAVTSACLGSYVLARYKTKPRTVH